MTRKDIIMKLYNSLTRTKDEFVPNVEGKVTVYTCGPTVYHFAHIGNLRTYIMEDALVRSLEYLGYDVNRIMNITDVGHLTGDSDDGEDKMLKGAKREKKSVMEIAKFYTDAFFKDCQELNIKKPTHIQPATGCIPEFIEMIEKLLKDGYAYEAGGNVYFDISKIDKYYVFGEHNADDLEVGVREGVEGDDNKRNPADFALWFTKSKFDDQELKWDSPWGVGYPGWHIECSAISLKYGGEYLDIHCGGIDNAFPHHTNEIAQSEAYLGHKWCNFWFHVLHLNTSSGKMSKSKGEFLILDLLKEKGYDPLSYRFFCLLSHYRKPLVFSYDALDNAVAAYKKLRTRCANLKNDGEVDKTVFDAAVKGFSDAIGNDINTSLAITAVYDALKLDTSDATKRAIVADFDRVLALDLLSPFKAEEKTDEEGSDPEILAQIALRAEAKKAKNYAEADRIRNELASRGITLIDTPNGTTYKIG